MKWEEVTLGDISTNIQTGPFGSQLHQSDYSMDGVPVVMPKDLIGGKVIEDSIAKVEEYHINRLSRHKLKEGNIIYARRGDVGKCSYITQIEEGWLCGTGCLKVELDEKKVVPKFVFYQLQKSETIGWIEKHAIGATMLNLNTSILSSVPISVPTLEIQQRIASILSAYDDLIENNQKQIKLLEEAAQRLYKEWFVDLRFPGYEDVEIVDGVPKGWKWKKCNDVASLIKRGISPVYNDEGKYIVINQKCIRTAIVNMKEARRQEKDYKKEFNLMDGDIVICSTGMGTLGRVGKIYGVYENTTFDSHVTLVRSKDDFGKQYLYHWMKHRENYLMSMGQGSTQQQELYRGVIEMLDVLVPNEKLLSSFEHNAQEIHNKIIVLNKQLDLMVDARDRLLPKLMSGEVEV